MYKCLAWLFEEKAGAPHVSQHVSLAAHRRLSSTAESEYQMVDSKARRDAQKRDPPGTLSRRLVDLIDAITAAYGDTNSSVERKQWGVG